MIGYTYEKVSNVRHAFNGLYKALYKYECSRTCPMISGTPLKDKNKIKIFGQKKKKKIKKKIF